MSHGPCEHSTNAVGWVLGALSPDEGERFAAHLKTCPTCQAEVARLTEAAEQLAEAPPLLTPPPELRERIMDAVHAETSLFHAARTDHQTATPAHRFGRSSRRARAVLALCATVAIVVAAIALLTQNRGAHQITTRTVIGRVTPLGGCVTASAIVHITPQTATLILTRLTAPPAGKVYQTWVIRRDAPPTRPEPCSPCRAQATRVSSCRRCTASPKSS